MNNYKTALFDFDGVIGNTEPMYDIFWNNIAKEYNLKFTKFAAIIKGTTLDNIMKNYFADVSQSVRDKITANLVKYERSMPIMPISGSIGFLETLRKNGVKIGLVTSSDDVKTSRALKILNIENAFDTIVTANQITKGKPDPMCYLLAAQKIGEKPNNCLVFEDSFAGLEAGANAKMRVIALSTTNSAELLKDKAYEVIPNFENITFEKYKTW